MNAAEQRGETENLAGCLLSSVFAEVGPRAASDRAHRGIGSASASTEVEEAHLAQPLSDERCQRLSGWLPPTNAERVTGWVGVHLVSLVAFQIPDLEQAGTSLSPVRAPASGPRRGGPCVPAEARRLASQEECALARLAWRSRAGRSSRASSWTRSAAFRTPAPRSSC